ncbi:kynurenine 3-monooxygenase, mitochondrial precursor [Entomophthora muscae]|uniref:Kynurenine 3-monooxygenase, mitochondrial n=2 Tax=Entomophthora muscae TaxID=34485 RepID=A0ACC2UNB5_9FUNG|nr:kynurenine 3-monooxygenase, mitochondrial precursor [Entomophthora muscae]
MEREIERKRVAIVGAGLVGSLSSVYFAHRGWDVLLFEKRPDIRKKENFAKLEKRSINLALSQRGISALSRTGLGLDKLILSKVIPMKGRMIHDLGGNQVSQAYGLPHQHINSVDRGMLNEELVNTAASLPNVTVIFEQELKQCDLDSGTLTFSSPEGQEHHYKVDLVFGADGVHSRVRGEIMKKTRMDYSQSFIDHGYCELTIPPKVLETGETDYEIDPNHLHIWPRHSYMMIALPNLDKSFTCTLFAPLDIFDSIKTEVQLMELFEKDLADAIPLIGREALVKEYFTNPKGSLMTIKCKPYHFKGRAVIVGDAAHCMVPFYGQGMNAGFEDVEKFFDILDKSGQGSGVSPTDLSLMESCLNEYSITRHPDVVAICDLALHNYVEMRSSVVSFSYLARKRLEAILHRIAPNCVIPLYTMVSFSTMRYSEVWQRWQRQSNLILNSVIVASSVLGLGSILAAYFFLKPSTRPPPGQTIFGLATQVATIPMGWAAYAASKVYRQIQN